jgi:hypothetical protein
MVWQWEGRFGNHALPELAPVGDLARWGGCARSPKQTCTFGKTIPKTTEKQQKHMLCSLSFKFEILFYLVLESLFHSAKAPTHSGHAGKKNGGKVVGGGQVKQGVTPKGIKGNNNKLK